MVHHTTTLTDDLIVSLSILGVFKGHANGFLFISLLQ